MDEGPHLGNPDVSKWEPMLKCLRGNGITSGSGQQLVVFTEYADTAKWLVRMFVNESLGQARRRLVNRFPQPSRLRLLHSAR